MEGQIPYYVERAKTGRASCRGCRTPCLAGELRMAKVVIGPYGDNQPMKTWYHVDCLMNAFMKQRKTTKRISGINEVDNFSNLTQDDKEFILKKINDMEIHYGHKNKCQPNVITDSDITNDIKNMNSPSTSKDVPKSENVCSSHRDNLFVEFHELCKKIAHHDKYTDKTEIVKNFFLKGTDGKGFQSDILVWTKLLLPGVVKKVYNLKKKQLVKLFSRILRVDEDDMLTDLENGNVGETLKKFYLESYKTCAPNSTLTVFEIETFLDTLTTMTKEDEQTFHFNSILGRCTAEDLKYIVYLINGDLKMNAGCKHILNALHPDAYSMYQSSSDMDNLVSQLIPDFKASSGSRSISPKKVDASLQLMVPISPMLAEACKSAEMAMNKCPNGMLSEIKYDGERVQLHKSGGKFQYFSRSLKKVMDHKIAHIEKYIPKAFPHGNDLVLDSEVLMVNTKTGELLPFGSLGIHKKNQFQDAQVCLFVFDCMYYNGESLINKPLKERRKILKQNMTEIKNRVMFSEAQEIHKISDLERMIATVFNKNLEGLVLKDLESKYEPGKRHWLKLKKDYLLDGKLADSADLVVIGAWFGNGKKGGMLSIFLMGCYDEDKDRWLTVTKVSTGHDDDTLASLQSSLMNGMVKISRDSNRVPTWMRCTKTMVPDFVAKNPKEQPVWEISGAEFSQAAIHTADGISIRFPRVAKIREDKNWKTATSFKELKLLYENSKENKDYSYLIKSDVNAPGCSKYDAKDEDNLFDCPDLDIKIDNSIQQSNLKRMQEEDVEICPAKKIKNNNNEVLEEIGVHTPKNALPNIFSDFTIFFCVDNQEELENPTIKQYKRYWLAYGGNLDVTEDGSQANYVIHLNKSIKWNDYINMNYKISNSARHVHISWLQNSLQSKQVLDFRIFPVNLTFS